MMTILDVWCAGRKAIIATVSLSAGLCMTQAGLFNARPVLAKPSSAITAPLATPPGITLQIEVRQPPIVPLLLRSTVEPRFGDASGRTLYFYEKDVVTGQSACNGECAKTWPPVPVPAGAKGDKNWSIINRADGSKQWAYRGKPLYLSVKDTQWGELKGNAAENGAWHVARPNWGNDLKVPKVIQIREVSQVPGQVLTTATGLTLYGYRGDPARDAPDCGSSCEFRFQPFSAPLAAIARDGEFTFVDRLDGVRQWAFRGRPLYTFTGDVEPGDQNGANLDVRYKVEVLERYFAPPAVTIRPDQRFGGVWTTVSGMTLYARETARYPASGATHARGGTKGLFQEGLAVGTTPCEVGNKKWCEESFQPLIATPDAQPSGYWTLYQRADGSKQWAYQGYALYTFKGDKVPGDMNGRYDFDLIVNDSATEAAPAQYQSGLFWRISTP